MRSDNVGKHEGKKNVSSSNKNKLISSSNYYALKKKYSSINIG